MGTTRGNHFWSARYLGQRIAFQLDLSTWQKLHWRELETISQQSSPNLTELEQISKKGKYHSLLPLTGILFIFLNAMYSLFSLVTSIYSYADGSSKLNCECQSVLEYCEVYMKMLLLEGNANTRLGSQEISRMAVGIGMQMILQLVCK